MNTKSFTRLKAFLIALLFWATIYIPMLGSPEFKGEEGRRVLPAVNMLQTGDWIIPSIGGKDYYSKPPGINWLVAGSFIITGQQNEFTARLPSIVFVLIFVSLLIWMPSGFLNLSARFIAAIVFLTCIGMIDKGRLIEIEAIYISLTGIAILWWLNIWSSGSSKWLLWIVPSLILGYGLLMKGPFIVFFYYCVVLFVLVYYKRIKELFFIQHFAGLFIMFAIPLVWAYLAFQQTESSRMTGQMSSQFLTRILRVPDIVRLVDSTLRALATFLPWLIFIPVIWNKKIISRLQPEGVPLFKACRLSLVMSFFVIDLLPGGLPRYTMPAIPLAAILLGWLLSLQEGFSKEEKVWKYTILSIFLICLFTAIGGLIFVTRSPFAIFVSVATVVAVIIVLYKRFFFNSVFRLVFATGLLISVFALQYSAFAIPLINQRAFRRPAAVIVNKSVPDGQAIYVLNSGYQPFLFYVRQPLKYLLEYDQINEDVHYLLVEQKDLDNLQKLSSFISRSPVILYELPKQIRDSRYRLIKLE